MKIQETGKRSSVGMKSNDNNIVCHVLNQNEMSVTDTRKQDILVCEIILRWNSETSKKSEICWALTIKQMPPPSSSRLKADVDLIMLV